MWRSASGFRLAVRQLCSAVPAGVARRSALYIPGSNQRALDKAKGLAADVLILDCEDAVAPENKETARRQIADALQSGAYGERELVVRINPWETEWGKDDVRTLASGPPCTLLLPKAERIESIVGVVGEARARGWAEVPIWCMIETPRGVLHASELAQHPNVDALVAGTSDLAADLRCDGSWAERAALLSHLSSIVLAARAHGKACLDGVHLDLSDDAGFEASCLQGRALGFDGKTLIHPKTLAVANRVFAPSAAEVQRAKEIVAAFAEAASSGSALVVLDGKLVEELHVRSAHRLLALDAAIRVRER
jgi:citrate lyase subunit beta/citryl-CoA lyase